MHVKLISITQGAIPMANLNPSNTVRTIAEPLSPEELIAYTARVSNPANQMNLETTDRLLGYLIRNKHWSPFEMVSMTLEIVTSRGIAAQILRHRSFSFQEFSQRYAQAVEFETYEARRQDSKNRQNSINDMSFEDKEWFLQAQHASNNCGFTYYEEALRRGIAKEQARFLLPLATQTKLYMCGSARSWIHYILVRTEAGVQKEHRDIAIAAKDIFVDNFPFTSKALEWQKEEINAQ